MKSSVDPSESITKREFWIKYWKNFKAEVVEDVFFKSLFNYFPDGNKEFIEIGGFPGTVSVFLRKFKKYNVTLLDYYINQVIKKIFLKENKLNNEIISGRILQKLIYSRL